MLCPAGDDTGTEHLIQQPGQVVVGVECQGDVHVVRGRRSPALPPADVPEHCQRGRRMGWGGDGQQLLQQLFGVVDTVPLRGFVRGAEEGCCHGFVDAGHVCQDLVPETDVLQPDQDLSQLVLGGSGGMIDELHPQPVCRVEALGRTVSHVARC